MPFDVIFQLNQRPLTDKDLESNTSIMSSTSICQIHPEQFVSPGSYSFHMDFSLERARTLQPDVDSEPWLLEIAWLYNRVVETGSQIPVIDLAYELVLPEEFVGECVSYAMDLGFLTAPKRGTFGGVITPKALRKLKQVGKHKQ